MSQWSECNDSTLWIDLLDFIVRFFFNISVLAFAEILTELLRVPLRKYSALAMGALGWRGGGHLMGSKDKDSISTKYEVDINLHYIVHVIIKLNKSVTGKILKTLISVKCR